MVAPGFGGASLLQTRGRAQSEGETPGRVRHGHDPQPGHVGRQGREGEGENRVRSQEVQRHKESGSPRWLDYIEKSSPALWAGEFRVVGAGYASQ